MFKEQMNKIKSLIFKDKTEEGEQKKNNRKTENLVVFLIILIITLIVINAILNNDNENNENTASAYKELASESTSFTETTSDSELETKIENILETMSGVRKSKSIGYILTVIRSYCNV